MEKVGVTRGTITSLSGLHKDRVRESRKKDESCEKEKKTL